MKTIEQVLSSGRAFYVDEIACMDHARVIHSYQRPVELFDWSGEPKHIQFAFKVAFISVCHQFNWDYLQSSISKYLLGDPTDIVNKLRNTKSTSIDELLKDYPKQERVRSKERAALLRDVGNVINLDFGGCLQRFYEKASSLSIQNGDFHSFMDRFEGYRTDSLRKKTNVLTHDLLKEGIVGFRPNEDVLPAIDYHIMRLYLRTGRVIPSDKVVFKFLTGSPNPRGALVKSLREAVSEAEVLTAYYSGLSVADVNYIEWQVGRSICLNDDPFCDREIIGKALPDDIASICSNHCPYSESCLAFNTDRRFILFEEPDYISTNY